MIELMRRTMLAGLGATAVTYEKVEESLQDLVEKGKLSKEEAERTRDRILSEGKTEFNELQQAFDAQWQKLLAQGKVATHQELEALKRRVDILEKALLSRPDAPSAGGADAPAPGL